MKINKEKSIYIYTFAFVSVVIVAGVLSFIAMSLKPVQEANITNEKMQNILKAIGVEELKTVTREQAKEVFYSYVTERITIDYSGKVVAKYTASDKIKAKDDLDPFNIDLRKEYSKFVKPIFNKLKGNDLAIKKALEEDKSIHLPIFVCKNGDKKYFVLAFSGKGLWDDIWGYIGLDDKAVSITGVTFDHKGETPGLGSKITEEFFQNQFVGKMLTDAQGNLAKIEVVKPGQNLNEHKVDGISGATFTGVGVQEMINRNAAVYFNFFKKNPQLLAL